MQQSRMKLPALVLVDLQKDFFDYGSRIGRLEKAVGLPATRRLLAHARDHTWPIFHVVTIHSGFDSLPIHLQRTGVPLYCIDGTDGAKIVEGLWLEGETLVRKQGYSAFDGTDLAGLLEGIFSVVLAGIAADCCILKTAFDAESLGKHVYLPYQAIGASGPDEYVYSLAILAKSVGVVTDVQELLTSSSPSLDHSLSLEQIRVMPSEWFQAQLATLNQLLVEVPTLRQMPIDDSLRLLEDRLDVFSET
jgi:nicotinamidase-related amidase